MHSIAGRILCMMPGCGKKDIDLAVSTAKKAHELWAEMSGFERMKLLRNAAILLKVFCFLVAIVSDWKL